jgi:hypothetical protein
MPPLKVDAIWGAQAFGFSSPLFIAFEGAAPILGRAPRPSVIGPLRRHSASPASSSKLTPESVNAAPGLYTRGARGAAGAGAPMGAGGEPYRAGEGGRTRGCLWRPALASRFCWLAKMGEEEGRRGGRGEAREGLCLVYAAREGVGQNFRFERIGRGREAVNRVAGRALGRLNLAVVRATYRATSTPGVRSPRPW